MKHLIDLSIIQGDLFTPSSLATLAGATGAVYIICSTIQAVFNFNPKWLALLVSILISYFGAYITTSNGDQVTKYIVALLNGFLIYMTSTGTNQIVGKGSSAIIQKAGFQLKTKQKRLFTTRWW